MTGIRVGEGVDRARLRALDLAHVWHPYTQTQDLAASDYPIIERGEGRRLFDVDGRAYWDGTSSMWLCVHGHRVPELDRALVEQAGRIAHATTLGQAVVPNVELAARLARASGLPRAMFSSDGSSAVETALKMAFQHWAQRGRPEKVRLASFDGAYHGDTLGAIAAAPVPDFHAAFAGVLGQPPVRLPWPDTTRGPHPRDPDATRDWALAQADAILRRHRDTLAAVVVEPVQVVGGVRIPPRGWLRGLRDLCRDHDVLLALDEVATGFGRTGTLFAFEREGARPDLLALGKGLAGGYLPMAATLASEEVHASFLGSYEDRRAFYHGHSYAGNALGSAVALASLDLLERELPGLPAKAEAFGRMLAPLADHPFVGEVRHVGLLAGVDLVADKPSLRPFPWTQRAGWAVHREAMSRGLLARPYASTGLLVPPVGSTPPELEEMVRIYGEALDAATPELRRLAAEPAPGPEVAEVPR
jgi:adenosylmethionine---8-amino-7-oxononanoate aminotransferase